MLRQIASHNPIIVESHLSLLDGSTVESMALTPVTVPVEKLNILRLRSLSTIKKIRRFSTYLMEHKIDILQLYFRDAILVGIPAAYLAGTPRVVTTVFNDGYWMSSFDRWLYRKFAPFVDGTIVNCHAVKNSLISRVNWPHEKITVIENGIDTTAFANIPPWTPGTSKHISRRVGMIANLRAVKDPMTFLKAAAIVNSRHPQVQFTLAGEGDLRSELEHMRRDLGLEAVVDLPGVTRNVPEFLSTIDVAVLCSKTEGMSNAIIEYMAAGRPIIATDVGGNSELITHNQTGLLITPNSPAELGSAIERLLENPELSARMATQAQHDAVRRYDMENMRERYENYYSSLLNDAEDKSIER